MEYIIPDIYKNTEKDLKVIKRPRVLKSHEYYDPRQKKLIYLVRDPRDVVISYYHCESRGEAIFKMNAESNTQDSETSSE